MLLNKLEFIARSLTKINQKDVKDLEKEIIKAIKIESEIPLSSKEGYKDLIKFVKKLFKEYLN